MRKLHSLIFCLLAACGCAVIPKPVEPEPVSVTVPVARPVNRVMHVDTDCGLEEAVALVTAAERWSAQTSHMANVTFEYDLDFSDPASVERNLYNHVVLCMDSSAAPVAVVDVHAAPGTGVLAWVLPAGGFKTGMPTRMVLVKDRLDIERRERVILHEMGHLFGIGHLPDPDSIMVAGDRWGKPVCLTATDLSAFCKSNECGSRPMLPCE